VAVNHPWVIALISLAALGIAALYTSLLAQVPQTDQAGEERTEEKQAGIAQAARARSW
jgi:hypothetical protein